MKSDRVSCWPGSLVLTGAVLVLPCATLPFRSQLWAPWAAIVVMLALVAIVRKVAHDGRR